MRRSSLMRVRAGCAVALALLSTLGCARTNRRAASSPSQSSDYTGKVQLGKGVACSYLGQQGPPSYQVRDIGSPGVPKVDVRDLRVLHEMMHYVHPGTLRFAYLDVGFSVFDATNGPCSGTPYAVLNGPSCNAIYVPYDATGKIGAATGCNMKPRPWIPNDVGNPKGSDWNKYPNPP